MRNGRSVTCIIIWISASLSVQTFLSTTSPWGGSTTTNCRLRWPPRKNGENRADWSGSPWVKGQPWFSSQPLLWLLTSRLDHWSILLWNSYHSKPPTTLWNGERDSVKNPFHPVIMWRETQLGCISLCSPGMCGCWGACWREDWGCAPLRLSSSVLFFTVSPKSDQTEVRSRCLIWIRGS